MFTVHPCTCVLKILLARLWIKLILFFSKKKKRKRKKRNCLLMNKFMSQPNEKLFSRVLYHYMNITICFHRQRIASPGNCRLWTYIKYMVPVLKYQRYWARVRKHDRRRGLPSLLPRFRPKPKYRWYFKTVIMYFVYPATLTIWHIFFLLF